MLTCTEILRMHLLVCFSSSMIPCALKQTQASMVRVSVFVGLLLATAAASEAFLPEAFQDDCWQKKPCTWKTDSLPQVTPSEMVKIIDNQWSIVEVIWGFEQEGVGLRLGEDVQIGSVGGKEDYIKDLSHMNGVLDGRMLMSAINDLGATLIMTDADGRFYDLRDLQSRISSALHLEGSIALYYTAQGTGVPVHQDHMDVIACQVMGQKRWKVWDPNPSPERCIAEVSNEFKMFNLTSSHHVTNVTFLADTGLDYTEYTLSQNDCLYLPRGVPHQAFKEGSEPSLHISIGLEVVGRTWEDVLHYAISESVEIRTPVVHDDPNLSVGYPELMHLVVKAASYDCHILRMIADKDDVEGLAGVLVLMNEIIAEEDFISSLPVKAVVLRAAREMLMPVFSIVSTKARNNPEDFLESWNRQVCKDEYTKRQHWYPWYLRNMKSAGVQNIDTDVPISTF
eukprot:TRINITY_DN14901_c0_g1_i1.p1 TRINITY_DN14901_c0_g1~~TRINITY_DN14901_c0_g1_i1.p1  ORF type:complete len:453 (+),score=62.00 TRINITY_DN14901_c0_g1_i1:444-1802(+)